MYLRRSRVNDQAAIFGRTRYACFLASAAYGAVMKRLHLLSGDAGVAHQACRSVCAMRIFVDSLDGSSAGVSHVSSRFFGLASTLSSRVWSQALSSPFMSGRLYCLASTESKSCLSSATSASAISVFTRLSDKSVKLVLQTTFARSHKAVGVQLRQEALRLHQILAPGPLLEAALLLDTCTLLQPAQFVREV